VSEVPESVVAAADAEAAGDRVAKAPVRRTGRVSAFLEAYTLVLLLIAIVIFFSVFSRTADTFGTLGNLQAVIGNQAVIGIVTLAALIPIVCDEWDLSVGANAGLCSIFVADAMSHGVPVALSILLGIVAGLVVGVFNALVVTRLGVNGIIATLGTATILRGIAQMRTGGVALLANIPTSVVSFGSGTWLGIPRLGWVLLVVTLAVYYLLNHTPFGRYLYAIAANREAAALVGLRTRRLVSLAFIGGGVLAGVAGALWVARAGGASPRVGDQFLIPALSAAFLSAAVIKPGTFNVVGAIVAVFFLAVIGAGLNLAGTADYVTDYVNGAFLIIGVGLAAFLGRKRRAGG
jgi:ribose transport system permease protein